jgi:hypothetical protein
MATTSFGTELDRWGTTNQYTKRQEDPFLHAVVRSAGIDNAPYRALVWGFDTLDDLLPATRADILTIKSVGLKTIALLDAELDRLGHGKQRRSVQS